MAIQTTADATTLINALAEALRQLPTNHGAPPKPKLPGKDAKIAEFGGKPGELVDKWIRDYTQDTERYAWTDAYRLNHVKFYLKGRMLSWYNTKYRTTPPTSWEAFCNDLRVAP